MRVSIGGAMEQCHRWHGGGCSGGVVAGVEQAIGGRGRDPSPLEAVGDGQQQLAFLKGLHLFEGLVIKSQEAAA